MFRKIKAVVKKPDKEKEEKWREEVDAEKLGAKDYFAMMSSAFLVIVLPIALMLAAVGLLMMWIFGAF